MAAFIWLFVANPNAAWTYLVGSDKVKEYGKKNEKALLLETLNNPKAHARVVYFSRTGKDLARPGEDDIDYFQDIVPYPWLKEIYDSGFFHKSSIPSSVDPAVKEIRKALSDINDIPAKDRTVGNTILSEFVPQPVIDYIAADTKEGRQLRFLYPLVNREVVAEDYYNICARQRALIENKTILAIIEAEKAKSKAERQADLAILGTLASNLKKYISKIEEEIEILDKNTALVLSFRFINDVNRLLTDFDKEPLSQEYYPLARALAYEVERRLSMREGVIEFSSTETSDESQKKDGVDLKYDRYNRILEGVVQIIQRYDYDPNVLVNPWGYTEEKKKEIIESLTEQFAHLFFANVVRAIKKKIAHNGYPVKVSSKVKRTLATIQAIPSEEAISAYSSEYLADNFIRPLVRSKKGLAIFDGLQEIFFLYSAGPGTGKGEIMDATFTPRLGKYSDLIDKFILYHTRNIRVKKGISEKDGITYHFRTAQRLFELKSIFKEIAIAIVNRQWQGAAERTYFEPGILIKNVTGTSNLKKDDRIIKSDKKEGIVLKRGNNEIVALPSGAVIIPEGKPGVILVDDIIEEVGPDYLKISRRIFGLDSVFKGKKPVILEGGYGWFKALHTDYPNITVAFIAPFSDEELKMRADNTSWIADHFTEPALVRIAYEEMVRLVSENKGEIDILTDPGLQREIKEGVEGLASSPLGAGDLLKDYESRLKQERSIGAYKGRIFDPKINIAREKISDRGMFLPCYGLTIITKVKPEMPLYSRLVGLQEELKIKGLEGVIAFNSPVSLHMTINTILFGQESLSGVIPGIVGERREQVKKAFDVIGNPGQVASYAVGIGIKKSISVLI
ncbi:MAG: DUF1868 domain-containing protein, partial [Candidatus Omnitrophica bacterium]|nr:DUF1868 domain-containing protein [Candidatus Omnitrophota bacterium]